MYRQRKNSVKKRTGSAKTVQKSVQANVEALQKSIQAVQKQYNCSAVCREDGKKRRYKAERICRPKDDLRAVFMSWEKIRHADAKKRVGESR